MDAAEYQRAFSTGHARTGQRVTVPADVRRVTESTPCTYCGVRPDVPCRHKRWAA